MRNQLKSFGTIVIATMFLASCKPGSDAGQLIPADALVVGYFNSESILKKLPYSEIESSNVSSTDFDLPELGEILRNPDETGVDIDKGLVLFGAKDRKGKGHIVFAGTVKSERDFEAFNKSRVPAAAVEQSGNTRRLRLNDQTLLGWNKDRFYYVINSQTSDFANWRDDDTEPSTGSAADLNAFLDELFTQSKKESLASEARFNDLMKESGDLKVWLNAEKFAGQIPSDMATFFRAETLLKDSRTTFVINFEDGYINASQKFYYGKELEEAFKKLSKGKMSSREFAAIPSDKIGAVIAAHFDPEVLNDILKLLGTDGIANIALSRLDVTLDDLLQSIDGKFLFSISDFSIRSSDSSFGSAAVDFNYLFKTGIRSKQRFQKLLDGATRMGLTSDMKYLTRDDIFITGNRTEFISQYQNNSNREIPEWAEKISGHPFGMYIDLQMVGGGFPEARTEATRKISELSKSLWKNFYVSGGDKEGSALTYSYRVNLLNDKENSLKQLNRYFNELRRIRNEVRAERELDDAAQADSLNISP